MADDRVVTKVAKLLNCKWDRVKDAVETRRKMMSELTDADMPGGYKRVSREKRSDDSDLSALNDWLHREKQSRFDSGGRGPMRKWIALKVYILHYRRTLTATRAVLFQRWLNSDEYREWQHKNKKAGGESQTIGETAFYDSICFCMCDPGIDQCANGKYTQLRVLLPVWAEQRKLWHKKFKCPANCTCRRNPDFLRASDSVDALRECTLCDAIPDPTLSSKGEAPSLRRRACCHGECDDCGLDSIGWDACKAEFGPVRASDEKFNYKQYRPMPRGLDKNTGKEKFENELVFVKGTRLEFMELLLATSATFGASINDA
jgi:hypothetical protein